MNQAEIEQRNALLGLLGTVYGESKKLDQNLVSGSTHLQPTSNFVKNMFERELRGPQLPQSQPSIVSPQPPIDSVNLPFIEQQTSQSQSLKLVDSNELVTTLKGIETNLSKLVEIFTVYDIKVQKKSNRKIPKLHIEDKRPMHNEGGEKSSVVDSDVDRQHFDPVQYTKPFE